MRTWAAWLPLVFAVGCYGGLEVDPLDDGGGPGGAESDSSTPDDGGDSSDDTGASDCDPDALRASSLRRLNRREYANTVRDVLGLAELPAVAMPWDDLNVRGFDNDGSVLSLGIDGAEQYYDAADEIARALQTEGALPLPQCSALTGSDLESCVDEALGEWLRVAFRRPVDDATLAMAQGFTEPAQSYDEMAQAVVIFTLTSPHFLFHPKEPEGFAIANRLAYLVWSSAPDGELLDAAEAGALTERAELLAQVDRMLADPKAARFYVDFADLWLKLGHLGDKPDAEENAALYADMRQETTAFFSGVAEANAPVGGLLDASSSIINGRLAAHYGIDSSLGDDEWAQTPLPASERAGVLTHASILAATATDFSDPIRRGVWVAEQIACQVPPPPSIEPPPLPLPDPGDPKTVRELLEEHRNDPVCAGCHQLFDPYGLALENYDRMGVYRTEYEPGVPIDASGELPSGAEFRDAVELSRVMAEDGVFEACVASFLSAYAIGRELEGEEECYLEFALEQARADGEELGLRDLLAAVVTSDLFVLTGGNADE